jgi:hypothetical protein
LPRRNDGNFLRLIRSSVRALIEMSHDAANDEVFARQLRDTAAKSAYPYEAFLFVYQTLPSSFSPELPYDHIDAAELCWRLRDRAIVDFGSAARERLASWSVRSCYDFGNIFTR